MTAESNKIENGCFFFLTNRRNVLSQSVQRQHKEASTKHCTLGQAHGGQFPHGVTSRQGN